MEGKNKSLIHKFGIFVLSWFKLLDHHKQDALDRGQSNEDIKSCLYSSFDPRLASEFIQRLQEEFGEEDLSRIPGVLVHKSKNKRKQIALNIAPGMLIPIFNEVGDIQGLQVRRDGVQDNKYVYVSSGKFGGAKISPVAHFARPLSADVGQFIITEGVYKANVTASLSKLNVIGLPSISSLELLKSTFEKYGSSVFAFAPDADHRSKLQVFSPVAMAIRWIKQRAYKAKLILWDEEYKGIDDALKAKVKLESLSLDDAIKHLDEIAKENKWGRVDWDGNGTILKPDYEWGKPQRLPLKYEKVHPFVETMIPEGIRSYVVSVARRMQAPIEYVATGLIIVLSGVIGKSITIYPLRSNKWKVTPNLWGVFIGNPSLQKTPVLKEISRFVSLIETEYEEENIQRMKDFNAQKELLETKKKGLLEKLKKPTLELKEREKFERLLADVQEDIANLNLSLKRIVINDFTVEKLHQIMSENPNGIILVRDELTGFFLSMSKSGHENDRAFILEAWSGDGSYVSDRISRGTTRAENLCLAVVGTIQPEVFQKAVLSDIKDGGAGDGLSQRFQLAVWPEPLSKFEIIEEKEDESQVEDISNIFYSLEDLKANLDKSIELKFDDEAQNVFNDWYVENKIRVSLFESEGDLLMATHLAKFPKLIPALALIFESINAIKNGVEVPEASVSLDSLKMSISWAECLESHAKKIYRNADSAAFSSARELKSRIDSGDIVNEMTVREIYRKGWTHLKSKAHVYKALEILEDFQIARLVEDRSDAGQLMTYIQLNPELLSKPTDNADIIDNKEAEEVSEMSVELEETGEE